MTRILVSAGVALAFTVGVAAQSTTPTTQQPYPPQSGQQKDQQTSGKKMGQMENVSLTGCLEQGDAANSFVLSKARMSEQPGKRSSGSASSDPATGHGTASGTTGTAGGGTGDMRMDVELVSSGSVSLKEHVGHEVEVTGTMSMADKNKQKGTTGSAAGETATDTTSRQGTMREGAMDKKAHKLTVKSLKHVSANCSR